MPPDEPPETAPCAATPPRRGVRRSLARVLRYARPHWKLLLASFLLMGVEAYAAVGRLVILLPVITDLVGKEEPDGESLRPEAQALRGATESGFLRDAVHAVVDPMNEWTKTLVPRSWIEDGGPEAERRYATLVSVFLLFVGFMLLMSLATYGEGYLAEKARLKILMDVRLDLCRVLLDQPIGFYDQRKRGEVVQRVLGDVDGYSKALNLLLKEVVKTGLQAAAVLTGLLLISWQLSLVCLLGLPFLIPLYRLTRRTLKRAHKRQEESARRTEVLLQIFSGIRTVKAYGMEARRAEEFHRADAEVARRSLKVQRTKSAADAVTEFINNLLALVLAIGGGLLLLRGVLQVSAGDLLLFFALVTQLYQPLKRFVKQMNHMQEEVASIERVTDWLDLPPAVLDRPGAVPFEGLRDAVRFEGVTFAYRTGEPVLSEVSFEVPRGATVALVGPSGSGKSTICDLLLRFYDPAAGRITLDGRDAREFRRASLLARTAVVTQTPFLFHTTVRENIRQGRAGATDAEVEDAARAAHIHEFVASQPRGYDEEVGEAGVRLSGGQRQRITIARALVRDPEILVLDEATASLDTASERAVQEALDRLRRGRTTLVVAHRLSTVRGADRIVVLDAGRVVDQGTHEELLARGGLYGDLVRLQDLSPSASSAEPE